VPACQTSLGPCPPILPLRLFAARKLSAANVVQALMSSAFLGFFFLGSLDLERVLGYGPMAIGLAFLPVAIVMGLFSLRFSALDRPMPATRHTCWSR
jgi:hypothetical protein